MKHQLLVLFLAVLSVFPSPNPAVGQPLPETVRYDLRGFQTGMVIATFSSDGLTSIQAFGFETPQRENQVLEDQVIPIPALSEILVGITVEALAAAEVLDPDAPISLYLTGLSPALGRATIHQLLSHTGGLDDARVRQGQSWDDALDELSDWALVTEPGFIVSRSRYSFPLIVRILERAVGETFSDMATAAVLDPLGLENTTFDLEEARAAGLIDGLGISTRPDTPFTLIPGQPTVRGLPVVFTTARDAVQLVASWMDGRLSGAVPWQKRSDSSIPNDVGLRSGVVIDEFGGQIRVSRSISDLGFGTGLHFFPELERGLFAWATAGPPRRTITATQEQILAQSTPANPHTALEEASARSDSVPSQEPLPDSAALPVHPSGWAGEYRNGDEILQLRETDGTLTFFTGFEDLGVRAGPDGLLVATLADGRATDISFRLAVDGKNRRYLLRGEATNPKAFLNEEDRKW